MKKRICALLASMVLSMCLTCVAFADGSSDTSSAKGSLAAQSVLKTQSVDETIDYALGEEYKYQSGGRYNQYKFMFTLTERSHVYALVETDDRDVVMDVYDSSGNCVSSDSATLVTSNSLGTVYTFEHSCNLNSGTYCLRTTELYSDEIIFLMTAEPTVSLSRPSITSLVSPSAATAKVATSPVPDALSYQYQFSKTTNFSGAKTITTPALSCTATGLARGKYYYVRVRPFTVYNDGLSVYGNWSRAQAVYVKKSSNKVTISTSSASFTAKDLKKSGKAFNILADDNVNAKLTYALTSVPAKAKKYLSINKSSGKVTVKKGMLKGTYKINVKVVSASTATHNSASATKAITLQIK